MHELIEQENNEDQDLDVLVVDSDVGQLTTINGGKWAHKEFALDFNEVFRSRTTIYNTLTRRQLLMIALRTCVRSCAFQFSFDSKPLLDMVHRLDQKVYVSAHTEMPHSDSFASYPIDRDRDRFVDESDRDLFPMDLTGSNGSEDDSSEDESLVHVGRRDQLDAVNSDASSL